MSFFITVLKYWAVLASEGRYKGVSCHYFLNGLLIALATAGGHSILVKLTQNVTSPAQQHLVFPFPGSAESSLPFFQIYHLVFL